MVLLETNGFRTVILFMYCSLFTIRHLVVASVTFRSGKTSVGVQRNCVVSFCKACAFLLQNAAVLLPFVVLFEVVNDVTHG